jgi:molybdopterin-containing oxidoreductase family iron-sulfur binding subunit
MNRLYVLECMPTVTGAAADHRAPVRTGDVDAAARALARALGVSVEGPDTIEGLEPFLAAAAADLAHAGARGLVVPGDQQPAAVHALAHAINDKLGAAGTTVRYIEPVEVEPVEQVASIAALAAAMHAGEVDVLVMLEANPVFDAPADLDFAGALEQVADRIHLGFHFDETARLCHWYIPATHDLEEWCDTRAFDGTITIVQPLIQPLYGGSRCRIDILAALLGVAGTPAYDIVREYWKQRGLDGDFESAWRRALHDGIVEGTASPAVPVRFTGTIPAPTPPTPGIEVSVRPDPSVYDGRFANNAWLMELPRPISKITWENAALVSPATGRRLGVRNHLDDVSVITLQVGETAVRVPALLLPGHADEAITLHLGYGRRFDGSVAGDGRDAHGADVYPLRTTAAPWVVGAAEVRVLRGMAKLATTQHHPTVQESLDTKGRHLVRVGTLEELRRHPEHPAFVHPLHEPARDMTLYPGYDYSHGNKWGMVIDLNTCIGCNACTVACQAENNIPTVGKVEVLKGRELHWIRLDRYWEGDEANPATYHQPLTCMHCENAPCETVCPVGATVHSAEGLNQMVYNRCVGTRYCSNNCPYKVRRFNFFKYADHDSDHAKLVRNPDVTVRFRGVMEKCSYCVQRINAARIEAKKDDNRPIRDGEVVAACQQACPVGAIAFGNLNDPESRVRRQADHPRNYGLLTELNVLPRTTYLAKLVNPNPDLGHPAAGAGAVPAAESTSGSAHP